MKSRLLGTVFGSVLMSISVMSSAVVLPLESRLSGQAYYDPNLGITWLTDANLAASRQFGVSGIYNEGYMNWGKAIEWIDAMNGLNGGVGYKGVNSWRLPSTGPVNGSDYVFTTSYNGSTDVGWNISAPSSVYEGSLASEMAFMFYSYLGNTGTKDQNGIDTDCLNTSCLSNSSPFSHLIPYNYWSQTEVGTTGGQAWNFSFRSGEQYVNGKSDTLYAWAVVDGDLFPTVPIPPAVWLFGSGLLGLVGVARRKAG